MVESHRCADEYDSEVTCARIHTHTYQDFTLHRAWESFVWQIMRTWFVYKFIHHAAFIIIGKWCNTLLYAKLTHDELMHLLGEQHVYVAFIYSLRELQFEYHKIISFFLHGDVFFSDFFFLLPFVIIFSCAEILGFFPTFRLKNHVVEGKGRVLKWCCKCAY